MPGPHWQVSSYLSFKKIYYPDTIPHASTTRPCLMASMELMEHSSTLTHMAATLCCTPCRASALVGMLRNSAAPTAAYAIMAAVEALAAVACEPGARTTDPILRHALLSEAGALGRPLFALFNHPASALLPTPVPHLAEACNRCSTEMA